MAWFIKDNNMEKSHKFIKFYCLCRTHIHLLIKFASNVSKKKSKQQIMLRIFLENFPRFK